MHIVLAPKQRGIRPWAWRALFLALLSVNPAAEGEVDDPARQAAVVYNLSKFVDWPSSAFVTSPEHFTLCLLGKGDPAQAALAALTDKLLRGRAIVFQALDDQARFQYGVCHLLFISQSAEADITALLPSLAQMPVLTVSDLPGFVQSGGMVGLIQTGERIRFEINLDVAKNAGLSVSTPLLELANVVRATE